MKRIRDWLKSSDAALFVETLKVRSYLSTLEAGEYLKSSLIRRDQSDIKAKGIAGEAAALDLFIDELERVAKDDTLLVKLASTPYIEPEEVPADETPTE